MRVVDMNLQEAEQAYKLACRNRTTDEISRALEDPSERDGDDYQYRYLKACIRQINLLNADPSNARRRA